MDFYLSKSQLIALHYSCLNIYQWNLCTLLDNELWSFSEIILLKQNL